MPNQSWFPLVTALGILVGSLAFAFNATGIAIGALVVVVLGAWMWSLEGPGHRMIEVPQARS